MTAEAQKWDELRRLAEAANAAGDRMVNMSRPFYDPSARADREAYAEYEAAADPESVLAILSELTTLRAALAEAERERDALLDWKDVSEITCLQRDEARTALAAAQGDAKRLHAALCDCLTMMYRHTWLARDQAKYQAAQKTAHECAPAAAPSSAPTTAPKEDR